MAKPDFTGTWEFNSIRSALQIPAPESSVFVIEHREPDFYLERTHVFGESSDTFAIALTTDGKDVVCNHRGMQIRARLYWEGETLVCDSILDLGGAQITNVVRYGIADEGQTFIAEERLRSREHNHENKWVFDRRLQVRT